MQLILHAPQIIWIILVSLTVILSTIFNNTEGSSNTTPVTGVIAVVLAVLLQIWGGVYKTIGMPQILLIILASISLFSSFAEAKGNKYKINIFVSLSTTVSSFGMLYWAGFFSGN
jgi:hypothetical protein